MKQIPPNPAMPAIDDYLAQHQAAMRSGAKLPKAKRKTP